MEAEPFLVHFLVLRGLSVIQVVPMVSRFERAMDFRGGILRGPPELLQFIQEVRLDSIVRTTQLADLPNPRFEREFYLLPPEGIVAKIEARFRAESVAVHRLLDGKSMTENELRALSPLEQFVLGSSELTADEGVGRVKEWFERREGEKRA
jgi:hypothetical protein